MFLCKRLLPAARTLISYAAETSGAGNTCTSYFKRSFSNNYSLIAKSSFSSQASGQELVVDTNEQQITNNVVQRVNDLVNKNEHGRLFAVVQVCGKQFKITQNDIIVIEGYWPPQPGDKIRLEKVLLAGCANFTLVGRPLLPSDQASVYATVIQKKLSHTRTKFRKLKKKQYMRINFEKKEETHLRINSISVEGKVNNLGSVDGLENRIFGN